MCTCMRQLHIDPTVVHSQVMAERQQQIDRGIDVLKARQVCMLMIAAHTALNFHGAMICEFSQYM